MTGPHLVVFCHLAWNFVYQRPQQVLTRIAHNRRIVFVQEPIAAPSADPYVTCCTPAANVLVVQPYTPQERGFHTAQNQWLGPLLIDLLRTEGIDHYAAWFYTPMAVGILRYLEPQAVIYDCMDELSSFLYAPHELRQNEERLFRHADLVFTGGPSLFRAKQDRHPNVYCFPSSVDEEHFGRAKPNADNDLSEAADQKQLPHPRLGFFGVLDERLDIRLIDRLAAARPHWQIVLVGPVVKIDPQILPQRPNIHYFSQRKYSELPSYLVGWDICLLPFARNSATQFVSPTKTLEYMAAQRPIVSTPITDVADPYGDFVYLGSTPEEFVAACDAALAETVQERDRRRAGMRRVLDCTSWDKTARWMDQLLQETLAKKHAKVVFRTSSPVTASKERTPPVIVIGAGPTGLSAAYHLAGDALLLERGDTIGGWCRSLVDHGFTFDYAGHIMFSNDAYVNELYELLLGDNLHWQNREAWIYSHGVHTRYPFQGSLYGLPPWVISECILGAVEARFGSIRSAGASNGNIVSPSGNPAAANVTAHHDQLSLGRNGDIEVWLAKNGTRGDACAPASVEDCCADGVLEATAELVQNSPTVLRDFANEASDTPRHFEEFIYKTWGTGIAKHFAIPYNRKLWAVDLKEMETSWLGGRVPMPDLEEMIRGAIEPITPSLGPNARFGYPLRGGFQALMNGFLPHLAHRPLLNCNVIEISPSQRTVITADGRRFQYEKLISTMPLPVLVRTIGSEAPAEIQKAARALKYVSVRCVHLGVGHEHLTDKHWIYYPEETIFHRIFAQGNASPYCSPPGGFGLTCEISYSPYKPLPCDGQRLIDRCIADCRRVGILRPDDPIWSAIQVDLPHAYVVYDHARPRLVRLIRDWLEQHDILLAGRYSEWEYYNSDHAFLAGKKAAERCSGAITETVNHSVDKGPAMQ